MDSELLPKNYAHALERIAVLSSLQPTQSDIESLHRGLVTQALSAMPHAALPEEICQFLHRQLGINISLEAVVRSVGRLVEDGIAQQESDHRVMLDTGIEERISDEGARLRELRQRVIAQWVEQLDEELRTEGKPVLEVIEQLGLEEDLDLFLLQLVRHHGVQLSLFLYPDEDRGREALDVDEKTLFRELPERSDRLREIRWTALPAFVREAGPERARFVAELVHRATLLQVLQVDADASALFSEILSSKRLFLDTNFVFRLLGLQGDLLKESASEALSIGQKLGHSFAISTKTFGELNNLLQRQVDWVAKRGDIPSELSEAAADFVAGNDYVSSFWKNRRRLGVTASQFQRKYSQLPPLLENLDISVTNDLEAEIDASATFREATRQLKVFKPHDQELTVEHDAFHKVLIEKLRENALGRPPQGWYETDFLFLTFDNALPAFALRCAELRKGHSVPFCLLGHEWLELLQFARPDLELSPTNFVALLNSPYLESYFSKRVLDKETVRDIALTMAEMKEYRPQVAVKIFSNRALTSRLNAANDEGRAELLRVAIRSEAEREDIRMKEQLDEKSRQVEELEQEIAGKNIRVQALEQSLADEQDRRKKKVLKERGAREKVANEKEVLERELAGFKAEIGELKKNLLAQSELKEEVRGLQDTVAEQSRKLSAATRWLLLLPGVAFAVAIIKLFEDQADKPLWWVVVCLSAAPFVIGVFQQFRGRTWDLVSRLANGLAIAAFIWEYVLDDAFKQKLATLLG